MDLNEKPTKLLVSELVQEVTRCDNSRCKILSQGDGIILVAVDKDVHVNMKESGYLKDKTQNKDNWLLQSKVDELEFRTAQLEGEVKVLRERNEKLEQRIGLTEKDGKVNCEDKEDSLKRLNESSMNNEKMESDEDIIVQLTVEINVLQCEKQTAEREVEIWKHKCKELESWLLAAQEHSSFSGKQLASIREKENLGNDGCNAVTKVIQDGGASCVMASDKPVNLKDGIEVIDLDEIEYNKPPRKQLFFGDDETDCKKASPCTPRLQTTFTTEAKHISAADVLPLGTQGYNVLTPFASKEAILYSKSSTPICEGYEDISDSDQKISHVTTPKRKRSLNVVTSDTESEDDDDIPIGQLLRKNKQLPLPQPAVSESDVDSDNKTHKRHRLVKLSQIKGSRKTPTTDESENDDDDDESLSNFIVSGSEDSEILEEAVDVAQDFSDDNSDDFDGLLHKIKRTKDDGSKWELEGDMLAAFGKDPILCMKAVCALFRQQTSDEQEQHGTFISNGRGFSTFDALRGTELALFSTDNNPNGDVRRSAEQMDEFDPVGVETCRTLAARYSKQLFEIYQNGEDPYFLPQPQHDSDIFA